MHEWLTEEIASTFAALTLPNVSREYPSKLDQVLTSDADLRPPRALHPIFFGCFDWHSCVHGYWQLARLTRLFPQMSLAPDIQRQFDLAFTPANVQTEADYFARPGSAAFERPYGWAWLLALATELRQPATDNRHRWHETLLPLATVIARRLADFLPCATYAIRSGTHSSTAFALTLATEYAAVHGDGPLQSLIGQTARQWYVDDADCQAWEPSLTDFLSPALTEAACMHAVLPADEFRSWLGRFLPRLQDRQPRPLFAPATPTDRADGHIAHLDGLNLSRAWCLRRIAASLPPSDPRLPILLASADEHLSASLPHLADDYAGEHWLATFALLALSE